MQRHGLDPLEHYQAVDIDPALIDQPHARVPFARVAKLWGRVAEQIGEPNVGLEVAELYRATDFHGLAIVLLASRDLRTALERFVRYHAVVNSALAMSLEEDPDRLSLLCSSVGVEERGVQVIEDARGAILMDLFREASSRELNRVEVVYTAPEPADITAHLALFRCPVVFGGTAWKISFSTADLEVPFLASNRELARYNDQALGRMLKDLREDDIVSRVKAAMEGALPSGKPTEESIAREVSMSTRSLQRRLAEQGTNMTKLLAAVRKELALQYIANPRLAITEIAFMLGFSDLSSFSRAFKRWTGESPAVGRQHSA